MKILEKQKTRREAKKRIEKKSSKLGIQEINQEKGLDRINRIVRRVQRQVKREVLFELIKLKIKEEKVDFYLKVKLKRFRLSCLWAWKRRVDEFREKRKKFCFSLEKVIGRGLRKNFLRVTKDVKDFVEKSGKLMVIKLEKVQNKILMKYFRQVLKASSDSGYLKLSLALFKLDAIEKSKIRKGFCRMVKKMQSGKIKKSSKATEIIKRLISKQFNQVILRIYSSQASLTVLKISLAIEKLLKFHRRLKTSGFNSFKSLLITKFHKYSASIISRKLSNLLTRNQKFSFSSIKLSSKLKKQEFSLKSLQNSFKSLQKSLISYSFKSIKLNWKKKVSQGIIWKAKFYQLEGLIQHKKEEISLKVKLQNFYKWKKFVEEIKRIQNKVMIRRANSFYKIFKRVQGIRSGKMLVFAFVLMRNRWEKENKVISSLARVYNKQLLFVFFERFRRKAQGSFLSPKNRMSVYTSNNWLRQPSPSLPFNTKTVTKRYGFYSSKRLSLDHSVHKYIDQMIRVVPPSDKALSMSIANTHKRLDSAPGYK